MKVVITVAFCVKYEFTNDNEDGTTAGRTYCELTKDTEIPFSPFNGLQMQFPVIDTNHPQADRFVQSLDAPVLVTGIVRVEDVVYTIATETFRVSGAEYFETPDMLEAAVEQLVLGYGFVEV